VTWKRPQVRVLYRPPKRTRRIAAGSAVSAGRGLFVVVATGGYANRVLNYLVDESMLIGDATRPVVGESVLQRFGFADGPVCASPPMRCIRETQCPPENKCLRVLRGEEEVSAAVPGARGSTGCDLIVQEPCPTFGVRLDGRNNFGRVHGCPVARAGSHDSAATLSNQVEDLMRATHLTAMAITAMPSVARRNDRVVDVLASLQRKLIAQPAWLWREFL